MKYLKVTGILLLAVLITTVSPNISKAADPIQATTTVKNNKVQKTKKVQPPSSILESRQKFALRQIDQKIRQLSRDKKKNASSDIASLNALKTKVSQVTDLKSLQALEKEIRPVGRTVHAKKSAPKKTPEKKVKK